MQEDANAQKNYYKFLDIIRIISCVVILFYHLDLLDGGCLAVCSFFVLSGYLSCTTNFNRENFSLLKYYKNRLIKIYVPVVIVTFITVFVISLSKNIVIITLKQEVLSVLFAYNNFWQLSANCDYFAQHINTPFMHFWYVAILLQYELGFPFIFIGLKKLGEKKGGTFPVAITFGTGILSAILFFVMSTDANMMSAYYNSFARAFSWLFGISLGFFHCYSKGALIKNFSNEKTVKIIFAAYMALLAGLFIFVDEKSELLAVFMLISTILTVALVDYGVMVKSEENKILKKFSQLSYEIYLVQYPIIYIHDYIPLFEYANNIYILKLASIIILITTSSLMIQMGLNKKQGYKKLTLTLRILIGAFTILGFFKFVTANDYTEEVNASKIEMEANKALMEQKQKEFQQSTAVLVADFQQENGAPQKTNLKEKVKKLPVTAFGDSVLLGAVNEFYEEFPNVYVDAKVSRHPWDIYEPLTELVKNKKLGDPVIIALGTNGDCSDKSKEELLRVIGERDVFWITTTNDKVVKMNARLKELAKKHDNLLIIDWEKAAKGHAEYFGIDGIHLTKTGRKAYIKLIYDSIYSLYFERQRAQELAEAQAKAKEQARLAKIEEVRENIFKFISEKKCSEEAIVLEFKNSECSEQYIKERIAELQEQELIKPNKKGFYSLTKTGKKILKKNK